MKKAKSLVIAPTDLLNNWEAEIKKFAPSLVAKIYHGTQRRLEKQDSFEIFNSNDETSISSGQYS